MKIDDIIESYNRAVEREDREQAGYFLTMLIDTWEPYTRTGRDFDEAV